MGLKLREISLYTTILNVCNEKVHKAQLGMIFVVIPHRLFLDILYKTSKVIYPV